MAIKLAEYKNFKVFSLAMLYLLKARILST